MRPVTDELISARASYIQKWEPHLDRHFGHRIDVDGKRLFVMGSGWGAEAIWALKRGAAEVVGVDPMNADRRPFDIAMKEQNLEHLADRFKAYQATTLTVDDIGPFDVLMSNNVMEHVFGLSANLAALAALMPARGARFAVYTDPLYHSSHGHHLPIGPWEHLSLSQSDVRAKVGPYQWAEFREGLNGMTITSFLSAVREAGMILLEMSVHPDSNLDRLGDTLSRVAPGYKPMDLAIAGIGCTLAFPHNL
jgi:hypothetical protein